MALRVVVAFLWLTAIAAMSAAIRLPTSAIDLYFKDHYVVVTNRSLVVLIVVVLVIPLLAVTVRLLRPTHEQGFLVC